MKILSINKLVVALILSLIYLPAAALDAAFDSPETVCIDDVWTAYDSFNKVYLDSDKYIYKNTDRDRHARDRYHGAAAIWCQPMYVDMAMNAVAAAQSVGDKKREKRYAELLEKIIEGNIKQYQDFNFDNNDLARGWFIYDDIQWWTITMARAYLATGNERYRTLAERSFARVWYGSPVVGDTGSYADPEKGLGGGMFWQWQPISGPNANTAGDAKMSCINFPTVVAAMLLYEAAPADRPADPQPIQWMNLSGEFSRPNYETKERYLEMAKEIYNWAVENLADASTGKVYDNRHGNHLGGNPLIYNQGTYIGASALLYLATGEERYLDNAKAAADFSIDKMSASHGLLPWAHNRNNPYDQGSLEQGIYPAIWIEYMKLLVNDCKQSQYIPFIRHNIAEGWKNRDRDRNICDGESWNLTDRKHQIGSYAASTIPSMMLAFPPAP